MAECEKFGLKLVPSREPPKPFEGNSYELEKNHYVSVSFNIEGTGELLIMSIKMDKESTDSLAVLCCLAERFGCREPSRVSR